MQLSAFGLAGASLGLAGCATHRPAPAAAAAQPVVRETLPMHEVETRYDLRSYVDGDDPAVRHEAHVVYRATLVPARVTSLETNPRKDFAPVTYDPLPPSAELAAEIAQQKEITGELRTIQAAMLKIETQAQSRYGTLVDQTAQAVNLRHEIEDSRGRLESKPDETTNTQPALPAETNW